MRIFVIRVVSMASLCHLTSVGEAAFALKKPKEMAAIYNKVVNLFIIICFFMIGWSGGWLVFSVFKINQISWHGKIYTS